jgi:excisionase family DNA binding protein
MDMQQESLMDVLEAARYLNIGRSKLYEMAKAQMLPYLRVGTSLRFDRAALDEWIRREMRIPSGDRREED